MNNGLAGVCAVVLLGMLVYSNTLHSSFQFDDVMHVQNNPYIRSLTNFIPPLFPEGSSPDPTTRDVENAIRLRYVGYLTFVFNYGLNGLDVKGYHLFNIALHLINALLLYKLVLLTFRTPFFKDESVVKPADLALFSALIFVCHPIQTQAVTYIVQRFASLATFFYLLSLVLYVQSSISTVTSRRYAFYAVSLLSAVLAMKTKEIAFTLPVMIGFYDILFFRRTKGRRLLILLPFIVTMFIIPLSMLAVHGTSAGLLNDMEAISRADKMSITRLDYLFTQFRVLVTYIRLMFPLAEQNLDYDYPIYHTFFTSPVILSFALLLALFFTGVFLAYRSRSGRPELRIIALGIGWFFIALSVESSIIPIEDVIYEHRMYLPSAGFIIAFVASVLLVSPWVKNRMPALKHILLPVALSFIALLALAAHTRNFVWKQPFTLWRDNAEKSPLKPRVHLNLGAACISSEDAISEFQTAISLKPDMAEAHTDLGNALCRLERFSEAEKEYKRAVDLKPGSLFMHMNLGGFYEDTGRFPEAVHAFLEVIPDYAPALYHLGIIFNKQGKYKAALRSFSKAIKMSPYDAHPHLGLGLVLEGMGMMKLAHYEFSRAHSLRPDLALSYNHDGVLHYKAGKLDKAIEEFGNAVRLSPEMVQARYNLGLAFLRKRMFRNAEQEFQRVIEMDPKLARAHYNLGLSFELRGLTEKARDAYVKALELEPEYMDADRRLTSLTTQR